MFEEAVRALGAGWRVDPEGDRWVARDAEGRARGWAGALEADAPRWAAPVFGFELDLVVADIAVRRYEALPVFPPADRDLALVLPEGLTAATVEAVIRREAGDRLESAHVFDEFRGKDVQGRSVAWRLVFRDPARTLRDGEVDGAVDRILTALRSELGVERRQT
jgi:phenylalanyl-tRNA synthetase beta chain